LHCLAEDVILLDHYAVLTGK